MQHNFPRIKHNISEHNFLQISQLGCTLEKKERFALYFRPELGCSLTAHGSKFKALASFLFTVGHLWSSMDIDKHVGETSCSKKEDAGG